MGAVVGQLPFHQFGGRPIGHAQQPQIVQHTSAVRLDAGATSQHAAGNTMAAMNAAIAELAHRHQQQKQQQQQQQLALQPSAMEVGEQFERKIASNSIQI